MARGHLRVYLGAAPGVGKTFAMLGEGRRRKERGTDVIVGIVETHGRPRTAEAVEGFEVVPRRPVAYRGATLAELDVDAIIQRRPEVVLIDELAHTNAPGSRHEKRWQDVDDLLDAGIDVVSTVNIQHLASLTDVVAEITGVVQRETVPDHVVRRADQVELVDMAPEALRRRMAHGNVYAAEKVDAALSHYFRVGNLTALRELALLWLADKVDDGLQRYREAEGISKVWETRERIVVALTGGPEGETLIRRASRIAERASGAELVAVHVARTDGLKGSSPALVEQQRVLVESLGGTYHQIVADDVAEAVIDFSRRINATQVVLGTTRRPWLVRTLTGEGVSSRIIRRSGEIDVHLVTHEAAAGSGRVLGRWPSIPGRAARGVALALVLLPLLTLALWAARGSLNYSTEILLYLLVVVAVAAVGGVIVALVTAVAATVALNYLFTEPLYTLTVTDPENVVTLIAFVSVAAVVAAAMDLARRRAHAATRATEEASLLATLSGDVLRSPGDPQVLLDRMVSTFGLSGAQLLEPDGAERLASGAPVGGSVMRLDAGYGLTVAIGGADDVDRLSILEAYAVTVGSAAHTEDLARIAADAAPLAEADRVRTALLRAVSHDLRTPLAAAKAAVSGLRSTSAALSEDDRAELLAATEDSVDRLTAMVDDLLDVSRLEAGAVALVPQPTSVADVLDRSTREWRDNLVIDVPEGTPDVLVDPAILERVVSNLVVNAMTHGASAHPVRVAASVRADRVEIRVVDRGAGLRDRDPQRLFAPFQRAGDRNEVPGNGLGLAVVKGFTEAMGGYVSVEDTPGGGMTAVLDLPAAPRPLLDEASA